MAENLAFKGKLVWFGLDWFSLVWFVFFVVWLVRLCQEKYCTKFDCNWLRNERDMTVNILFHLVKISYISIHGHVEFSKSRRLPFNNGSVEKWNVYLTMQWLQLLNATFILLGNICCVCWWRRRWFCSSPCFCLPRLSDASQNSSFFVKTVRNFYTMKKIWNVRNCISKLCSFILQSSVMA